MLLCSSTDGHPVLNAGLYRKYTAREFYQAAWGDGFLQDGGDELSPRHEWALP